MKTLTVRITKEDVVEADRLISEGYSITRCCVVARALSNASNGKLWDCGYTTATCETKETVRLTDQLTQLSKDFVSNLTREQLVESFDERFPEGITECLSLMSPSTTQE